MKYPSYPTLTHKVSNETVGTLRTSVLLTPLLLIKRPFTFLRFYEYHSSNSTLFFRVLQIIVTMPPSSSNETHANSLTPSNENISKSVGKLDELLQRSTSLNTKQKAKLDETKNIATKTDKIKPATSVTSSHDKIEF